MTVPRPITILIAALGGEGGGVLTNWIVEAAAKCGFPVQSTSIPGVAQRTGATTYYIEILPVQREELGGKHPVLALAPGIGDVDVVLASELMEAGRTLAGGFVTPERTTMIASTSRFYVMNEKIAMGDGRYDQARLIEAINSHAKESLLLDLAALARRIARHHQFGHARCHRRQRQTADPGRDLRSRDQSRRQGGRQQPEGLSGRARRGRRRGCKACHRGRAQAQTCAACDAGGFGTQDLGRHAAGRARRGDRRRPPARRLSGPVATPSSISTG